MKKASQRVLDILNNMTLEQKVVQLSCIMPPLVLTKGVFDKEKAEKEMPNGIGRMTQFSTGFVQGAVQSAEGYNAIQKYVIEKCGLPVIIQNESSSGLVHSEGTIFPVPIGLACSFEDNLAYRMGKVIGDEGKAVGVHAAMSPVADVNRDARWGRVDETFGEDPLLVARFTSEEVRGIQGDDYTKRCQALAKHWVGYGASEGGINCASINISPKELFEVYATPFGAAIKENDMQSIMVTYSDIDGLPMSVNEYYTKKVLREDLGFNGLAVCDGHSIPRVIQTQGMYEDRAELAGMSLKAGIDADTMTTTVYDHIIEGIEKGVVDIKDLDDCVLRTLIVREEMGLLDNPYVDVSKVQEVFDDPAADELSYEIAEKSITLLKNKDNVLPLKKGIKKVAVVGPFGNNESGYFGGYAYPSMVGSFLKTALDAQGSVMEGFADMINQIVDVPALKEKMISDPNKSFEDNYNTYLREKIGTVSLVNALKQEMPDTDVIFSEGSSSKENYQELINQALEDSKDSDLIVLAIGEITGMGADATSGEGVNNPDLEPPLHQVELIKAMATLNKPMVMVLFTGRPFALGCVEPLVDGIVEAWYPGPSGCKSVSKVLTGEVNPSGHLACTFPQISSQCPIYYGTKTGSGYMTKEQTPDTRVLQPLYPFGYGLSYTTFKLSHLVADKEVETGGKFKVSVDVENTGAVEGSEVVQIYTHSLQPTINRPVKELRGYKKVALKPGEKKTVEFTFDTRQFGYYNAKNEFVIEPRPQEIYACENSSVVVERSTINFTGEVKEILHDRVFNFEVVEK